MTLKNKLIFGYIIVAFLFAFYTWIFGDTAHKSFFYNLGGGLVWIVKIFPELGGFLATIIIVLFIGAVTVL